VSNQCWFYRRFWLAGAWHLGQNQLRPVSKLSAGKIIMKWILVLSVCLVLTLRASALAEQAVFEGDGLRMVIDLVDDKVSGTITIGGETYPFRGALDGEQIRGKFDADGQAFDFVADIEADQIKLKSGGDSYILKHKGDDTGDEAAPRRDDVPDERPDRPDQREQPKQREQPQRGDDSGVSDEDVGRIQVKTDTIIPWLKANPEFNRLPHPAWMRQGTIVSYTSQFSTSTRPIRDFSITKDGKIVDHRDISVAVAGTGYFRLHVLGMHPGVTAVSIESFLIGEHPGIQGMVQTAGTSGMVLPSGTGEDYWLHPDALQHLLKNPGGADVFPLKHKIGNKTYDAIGITLNFKTGWFHHIYDAETGVLLTKAHLIGPTHGADDALGPGDNAQQNTSMERMDFVGIRQSNLPWVNPQTPRQLIKPGEIVFEGTETMDMGEIVTQGRVQQVHRVKQAAKGWLEMDIDFLVEYQGQPPAHASKQTVVDRSNYWIDPKILANLRDRQELDSDPVTGHRVIVAGRQNGQICIVRVCNGEQHDYFYDMRTGEIKMARFTSVVTGGKQIREFQRTR